MSTYTPPLGAGARGIYGDGSDGALHVTSGTTQIAKVSYFTTIVVDVGAVLNCNEFLVVATTSIIINGTVDGAGANAVSATGGIGGSDGYGATGGNGAALAAGGAGSSASDLYAGGAGGNGGASTVSVHAGGLSIVPGAFFIPPFRFPLGGLFQTYLTAFGLGGGGGGGDATHAGGGGGGGGGIIYLAAPRIIIAGTATVAGGNGAAKTGGTAGDGGGGGGGVIWLVSDVPALIAGTVTAAGGIKGGASAADGSAGSVVRLG